MTLRETVFAVLLAAAAGLIVKGAADIYEPAGWITAGVLLVAVAWVVFAEVGE